MSEKKKLLIVEDNKAFALVLSNYYSDAYDVEVTHTASECQEILRRFSPDFVLLDYFLPESTGAELFTIIKSAHPSANVIILSSNESSKTVVDLIKIGVRNYVIKDDRALEEIDKILSNPDED